MVRIIEWNGTEIVAGIERLTDIMIDCIEGGALVGHILPVDRDTIAAYWRDVAASTDAGERIVLIAEADGVEAGTVQLFLSPEPNAPHRAEVYKLLVHRDFRCRGLGEALMSMVEDVAARYGRTLLLLDTVQNGAGERLYRRLGWEDIGVVPHHFVDPFGTPQASVYMMRHLRAETLTL